MKDEILTETTETTETTEWTEYANERLEQLNDVFSRAQMYVSVCAVIPLVVMATLWVRLLKTWMPAIIMLGVYWAVMTAILIFKYARVVTFGKQLVQHRVLRTQSDYTDESLLRLLFRDLVLDDITIEGAVWLYRHTPTTHLYILLTPLTALASCIALAFMALAAMFVVWIVHPLQRLCRALRAFWRFE